MITKAIIPVAGLGTRMLPATKSIPKEMLPIVDKPLIQYIVNEAVMAGLKEIILVTHSSKNAIENHFDRSFELESELEKRVKRQQLKEIKSICPDNISIMHVRQGETKGLAHAISKAKTIYIFAVRSSAALASFLGYYYSLIFENVKVISNYGETEIHEKLFRMSSEDVIIGISFPRYSNAAIKAMTFAHHRGAKVIALTDSMASPLVSVSDYVLIAKSDMASVVDSLVAPLSVINALVVATVLNPDLKANDTFSKLENIWKEYDGYSNNGEEQ